MNNNTEVVQEVFVPSPLQHQLLDTAKEMGIDIEWYTENILKDEDCLRGLELVES